MRTTHTLTATRASLISSALLIVAGLFFAFAPLSQVAAARQALAARANANPTVSKLLSLAPAPIRRTISTSNAMARTAAPAASAAMFQSTLDLDATPVTGTLVPRGGHIVYTFTLTADGLGDTAVGAGNELTVTFPLPANTTFSGGAILQQPGGVSTPWGCAGAGPVVCTATKVAGVATFAGGQSFRFNVDVVVNNNAPLGALLQAQALYNNGAPVVSSAASPVVAHVVAASADLGITKISRSATASQPGQPQNSAIAGGTSNAPGVVGDLGNQATHGTADLSYVLQFGNAGPDNAQNVIIEDSIPGAAAAIVTASPLVSQATINGGSFPVVFTTPAAVGQFSLVCGNYGIGNTFQCSPGDNTANNAAWTTGVLPAGFSMQLGYRIRMLASAVPGTVVGNISRITSNPGNGGPQLDPNAGNNTSLPTQNLVVAYADLGITKQTSNPTPVAGGAAYSYTLTVTNTGPSDASGVVVNDPLPAGILLANSNVAVVNNGGAQIACTGPANGTNGTVTCNGTMPAASQSVITIVAQAAANLAGGVRTNTASVTSNTTEVSPNVAPNTASVQNTITNDASISITKTGPATACAGDNLTYNIGVTNSGNSSAVNVVVTDVLPLPANPPPGFTPFVSVSGTNAFANNCSYNANTNTVTCTAGFLPTGTSNINLVVRTSPSTATGNLTNSATLAAAVGTITGTNPATASTTITHCSDLEITKDDSPDAVLAGQDINYTITLKNIGPSDLAAGQYVVNDTTFVPAGTTLKTGTTVLAPSFSCNGTTTAAVCTGTSPLPAGASATIKFTVTVNANFNGGQPGGSVVNTATAAVISTAANPVVDANSANNSSTVTTPIGPSADLSVTKQSFTLAGSAFDAQVTAGGAISAAAPSLPVPIVTGQGEIFYGLTYRNSGLGDAVNVHIRDIIPANVQFVPGSIVVTPAAGPALTCTVSPLPTELDCTPTGGGTLPAGANGTISFRTRVLANVADGTAIKNTATINSEGIGATPATPDPNGGNNTSNTTQNRVRTEANLSIGKTGPASVNAGTNITYTITVTNNGVSDAQNVVVKDTLPPNVSFVSASSTNNQFTCAPDGGNAAVVNCTAATLIANDPNIIPPRSGSNTVTITLVGKVAANVPNGTVLANNATVSSTTSDPVLGNNAVGPINTTVTTDSNVTINKVDNPDPVVAGTNLSYRVTVNNAGPSDAQAVSIVDTLPAGTTFVSFVGTGVLANAGVCANNPANTVTCAGPLVLPAGITWQLDIVVKVNPDVPANPLPHTPDNPAGLLNTAVINWSDSNGVVGPLVAQNATATQRTTVRHESDMVIVKDAPDYAIAGSRYDIRLNVANTGPSTVLGDAGLPGSIVVWDLLPVGTSLAPVVPNPFVQPGGPGNFACRAVTGQGPAANQTLVLCWNAADAAGNFPVGARVDIIVKVDTNSNLAEGSNLYNCAEVTLRNTDNTPEIDPNGGGQHNNVNPAVAIPGISAPPPAPAGALTNASGNNESCDGTVIRTSADLAIGKSAVPVVDPDGAGPLAPVALPVVGPNVPPGSVNAGGYIRYDVPFGNNGTSDAINVLITDQIAGNTAFVGALATGGVFVPAAQPPAVPFTFTIQAVDTVAPLGPNVNLTCTVWQAAGTQSIYCRPQGNTGLGAPGPYADGVLPAGYNATLTFFVKVNESTASGTIIANPANITSGLCPNAAPNNFPPSACASTADPNTSNNTSLATQTLAISSSNLTVSKIVQSAVTSASNPNQTGPIGPATPPNGAVTTGTAVLPGTTLTYRVTITNNGPSDVSNIRLTDVLPSALETPPGRVLGAKYISVTPVPLPSGVTLVCNPPTGVNPSNNPQGNGGSTVCTAPLLSANAPNNTAAVDITVFIDPATKANLVNTATFDATINNFNRPVSGSTTLTTPVAATSDLALTKTHTPVVQPFAADGTGPLGAVGGAVTAGTKGNIYTITATNNGPSTGQMFSLTDTLPPFQKVTKIEVGRLDGNGLFVTPNAKDGNGNANVSCTATPAIGTPGNTTSFNCTASELPPNKNADGTVNPAGTIVIRVMFDQDSLTPQPPPAPYQNCVSATSMSNDPVAGNNTNICDPVPLAFFSPLTATKTDTPDPVIAGNLLTYVITGTPQGPSAALNFTISDPLPQGTVFVSAVASAGATLTTPAVNANGTVTAIWNAAGGTTIGLTNVGVVRTLTIVVRVCPDFQQIRGLADSGMCVPNLTNNANVFSDTPPNLVGNPMVASATTTVQAQSDLGITKSGPASANPNTVVTYTLTVTNAGPSNANNVVVTDLLPKGFTLVPGSVSVTALDTGGAGPATVSTATDAAGSQTVTIGIGVVGAANQCGVGAPAVFRATQVRITLQALVPKKHPNIIVTNTATVASSNCLPETGTLPVQANPLSGFAAIITPGTGMLANNRAFFDTIIGPPTNDPGPGSVPGYPATAEISDQKAGSILMYPIYTSDAANPNAQNTRLSLTNISSTEKACVHLFLIDGASCSVVDAFICLTPNQTAAFTAADLDPGQTGFVVAVAVDCNTGLPMAFNCLIGDEYVKFATGHAANLGAEGIAAVMMFPAGTDASVTTTTLRFNGMNYNRLPRILAVDNVGSRGDQNDPLMIVNAIGGNYTRSGATLVSLFGTVFDDAEVTYSFTQSTPSCQFRSVVNNNFPRMITRFETAIPAGRTGWMKFWSTADQGIFGAIINRNPNAAASSGAFNQGHNLHKLTLTDQTTLTVPVLIPSCL